MGQSPRRGVSSCSGVCVCSNCSRSRAAHGARGPERAGRHSAPLLECEADGAGHAVTATSGEAAEVSSYELGETLLGGSQSNPFVRPGDVITVPEAAQVYVVGNVLKPSAIPLKERVTVSQAIAMAGGALNDTQSERVRVVRQGPGGVKTEIIVDLKAISKRRAEDLALQPNDIVEVPTASGNRFLRTLLGSVVPSAARLPVQIIVKGRRSFSRTVSFSFRRRLELEDAAPPSGRRQQTMKSNKLTEVPTRRLPEPLQTADYAPSVYAYEEEPRAEDAERLRDFLRALRRRLWLVVAVTALSTALVAAYMMRQPDLYEAEAQVQVDLETINTAVTASRTGSLAVNPVNDPAYFNTQLQILTRPRLLRRVVRTLDLPNDRDFRLAPTAASTAWWQQLPGMKTEAAARQPRAAAEASEEARPRLTPRAKTSRKPSGWPLTSKRYGGPARRAVKEIRLPIRRRD